MRSTFLLFLALLMVAPSTASISVDARAVKATVQHPLGINTNYLTDHDLPASTLTAMGVRTLRYGADQLLWSTPPYEAARPAVARVGPWEWPSGDPLWVSEVDRTTWQRPPLDLDGAAALAQQAGAQLTIIVPLDTAFGAPLGTGDEQTTRIPTLDELKQNAVSMVAYAKAHAIPVLAWEIGNESYNQSFDGAPSRDQYIAALIALSHAMKAVDPSARIAANGNKGWWPAIVQQARADIDALSVHSYPAWQFSSYSRYRDSSASLVSAITDAKSAVSQYAGGKALPILVTEIGAIFGPSTWPDRNDLGHAVLLADAIGQTLEQGVGAVQLWNTAWTENPVPGHVSGYDALLPDGTRTASGKVIELLGPLADGALLTTTSTRAVRVYASRAADGVLRVLLINKDTSRRSISLTLKNDLPSGASVWQLSGAGAADEAPLLRHLADLTISSGKLSTTLPPVSITLLTIQKGS